jgi:hypothetical protein
MRQIGLALVLATVFGDPCGPVSTVAAAGQEEGQELTTSAIMRAPERYLKRTVTVVIVEPLGGPATEKALAAVEYGQVPIDIPDGGPEYLSLVPSSFRLDDPNRYKNKFDRPLVSPIKVRGEFLIDAEKKHRKAYVLRVISYEPLSPPAPTPVRSLAEIDAAPAKWDRRRIVYEGTYEHKFEVSTLDRRVWLGFSRTTTLVNAPATRWGKYKVRVTGYLYTRRGSYGHLGAYSYELMADGIEFL